MSHEPRYLSERHVAREVGADWRRGKAASHHCYESRKQSETTFVRYCANIPRRPRPERGTFIPATRSCLTSRGAVSRVLPNVRVLRHISNPLRVGLVACGRGHRTAP